MYPYNFRRKKKPILIVNGVMMVLAQAITTSRAVVPGPMVHVPPLTEGHGLRFQGVNLWI